VLLRLSKIGIIEASSRVRAVPDTALLIMYVMNDRNKGLRDLLIKIKRVCVCYCLLSFFAAVPEYLF
jgi:hypothetical protein